MWFLPHLVEKNWLAPFSLSPLEPECDQLAAEHEVLGNGGARRKKPLPSRNDRIEKSYSVSSTLS